MSITNDQTIKSTDNQSNDSRPPLYRIVCHADPRVRNLVQTLNIAHVIHKHIGFPVEQAFSLAGNATARGRITIKDSLTKEVGETIMADINECGVVNSSNPFSFKLERA